MVGGDDFTVRGGAGDAAIAGKQIYAERLANELRLPLVRLVEGTGGGGSVKMLEQLGATYVPVNPGWDYVVDNLSTVPVVAAGLGPVAGLGAARLCAAHLSILVEGTAQLFVAGPPVVRSGAGEDVDKEQLGGVRVHGRNAAVDLVAASEPDAFGMIRRFLSYLPSSAYERPPVAGCDDPPGWRDELLLSAIPRDRRRPYRIREILRAVFDAGSVMEAQRYGGSIVTALPLGARVVVPDVEFTSTLFPLLVQERLEVRTVPRAQLVDAIGLPETLKAIPAKLISALAPKLSLEP